MPYGSLRNTSRKSYDQKGLTMQPFLIIASWLPNEDAILLALLSLSMAAIAGSLVHRVMGSASFGQFGNAILILFAIIVSQWVDPQRLGFAVARDGLKIAMMAAAISTLLLATAGIMKSWISRNR
jgi:hypothetical protein